MAKGGGGKIQETALDKELASIGVERYDNYVKRYIPIEDYAIDKVLQGREGDREEARGVSNVGYEQAFAQAPAQTVAGAGAANLGSIDSGRAKLGLAGVGLDKSMAKGLGAVDTNLGSEGRFAGNIQSLVNIGQGKAGQALSGLTSAANVASRQAIMDAEASAAARNAIGSAIGTAAGIGYGAMTAPNPGVNRLGTMNQAWLQPYQPMGISGPVASPNFTGGGF